MKSFAGNLG